MHTILPSRHSQTHTHGLISWCETTYVTQMSLTLLSHRLSHLITPLKKTTSLHNHITDMAVDYKRLKTKKTAGFLNYTCFGEQREGKRERETPCACNIERVVNKLRLLAECQLCFIGQIKLAGFHRMLPNMVPVYNVYYRSKVWGR